MIERRHVQKHAESFLARQLQTSPVKDFLTRPGIWNVFLDRLHVRTNQIDIYLAGKGIEITLPQVNRFIENATIEYAHRQVEKRIAAE